MGFLLKQLSATEMFQFLFDTFSSKNGMYRVITLERDKMFDSNYFKDINKILKIGLSMALAKQAETY